MTLEPPVVPLLAVSNAGLLRACEPLHKRLVRLKASGLRVRCSSLQVCDEVLGLVALPLEQNKRTKKTTRFLNIYAYKLRKLCILGTPENTDLRLGFLGNPRRDSSRTLRLGTGGLIPPGLRIG